jgi:hypothetical protein
MVTERGKARSAFGVAYDAPRGPRVQSARAAEGFAGARRGA